jgi:hypothetical protein
MNYEHGAVRLWKILETIWWKWCMTIARRMVKNMVIKKMLDSKGN